MPSVARGNGTDSVFSKTGSGKDCASPLTTATDVCSGDVFSNNIGVVREDDQVAPHPAAGCGPDESVLTLGAPAVFANFQEVGRIGDEYTSDNIITSGSSNVFEINLIYSPLSIELFILLIYFLHFLPNLYYPLLLIFLFDIQDDY
jgi:uncharacterized Zn-binding protein involved in type VI secretion